MWLPVWEQDELWKSNGQVFNNLNEVSSKRGLSFSCICCLWKKGCTAVSKPLQSINQSVSFPASQPHLHPTERTNQKVSQSPQQSANRTRAVLASYSGSSHHVTGVIHSSHTFTNRYCAALAVSACVWLYWLDNVSALLAVNAAVFPASHMLDPELAAPTKA